MKRKSVRPSASPDADIGLHIQAVSRTFSGPLPPPEALGQYNDAVPGAAERILVMAESQQQHRQTLERRVVEANIQAQRLGSALGFLVAMTAISGGIYLIAIGRSASGLVSILATLSSLVWVFVYGKMSQKQELAERSKARRP